MKFAALLEHNVPKELVAALEAVYGPDCLRLQARAFREYGLLGPGNVVIEGATGSGKTVCAEVPALKAALEKRRSIFIEPQRALAHEKYCWLKKAYGPLGLTVVVSSRDHQEFDSEIARGGFDIAVVVVEKLHGLLVSQPRLLEQVGIVVVDELQLLGDPKRGPTLEMLITKILRAKPSPRIIGLSAVLGDARAIAEWLGARVLVERQRPIDLRKGYLCKGRFIYRDHNTGAQGVEEGFTDPGSDRREDRVAAALNDLAVKRHEQVIFFDPDRRATVKDVMQQAPRLQLPPATETIERLSDLEISHARDLLIDSAQYGAAIHTADMSSEQREIVEDGFRKGEIRVIFSTTTLAMGMNLPARNVLIETRRWDLDQETGLWRMIDIPVSEVENMSGRAGRYSLEKEFGRAAILEDSEFHGRADDTKYFAGECEPVTSKLKDAPLANHVLGIIAARSATTRAQVTEVLLSSLSGTTTWAAAKDRGPFEALVAKALQKCIDGRLVTEVEGRLQATDLGMVSASKGLHVSTTVTLANWARENTEAPWAELEVLTLLALTRDAYDIHAGVGVDRCNADYRRMMLERARAVAKNRPLFQPYLDGTLVAESPEILAFKKALLVDDWMNEASLVELEEQYELWQGHIGRITHDYAWLAEGLAAIAGAVGWTQERQDDLFHLATRVAFGIRDDAVGVAKLNVPGLGRGSIRAVVRAGLKTREDLASKTREELEQAIKDKRIVRKLWAKLHPDEADVVPMTPQSPPAPQVPAPPPAVAVPPVRPAPPKPEVAEVLPLAAEAEAPYGGPRLRFDKLQHRMWYGDQEVPTAPPVAATQGRPCRKKGEPKLPKKTPSYLPPQQFNLLMILGSKNQGVVRAVELWEKLGELGSLRKPGTTPELRNLKHRTNSILRSILCPLGVSRAEVDLLIALVPNIGLRLRASSVEIVGWPDGAEQPKVA